MNLEEWQKRKNARIDLLKMYGYVFATLFFLGFVFNNILPFLVSVIGFLSLLCFHYLSPPASLFFLPDEKESDK